MLVFEYMYDFLPFCFQILVYSAFSLSQKATVTKHQTGNIQLKQKGKCRGCFMKLKTHCSS